MNRPRRPRGAAARDWADADAKSAASDAAGKLAEAPSYRWTTTVATGDAGPSGRGGVTAGQTEKGGFTACRDARARRAGWSS